MQLAHKSNRKIKKKFNKSQWNEAKNERPSWHCHDIVCTEWNYSTLWFALGKMRASFDETESNWIFFCSFFVEFNDRLFLRAKGAERNYESRYFGHRSIQCLHTNVRRLLVFPKGIEATKNDWQQFMRVTLLSQQIHLPFAVSTRNPPTARDRFHWLPVENESSGCWINSKKSHSLFNAATWKSFRTKNDRRIKKIFQFFFFFRKVPLPPQE